MVVGVIAAAAHLLLPASHSSTVRATAPSPRSPRSTAVTTTGPSAPPVQPPSAVAPPTTAAPNTAPNAQPVGLDAPPAPEAPGPQAPAPPERAQVGVYGDSLTVLAWEHYMQITAGEVDSYEHARAATTLPDWSAAILTDPLDRLVLALGTNDATSTGAKPWADLLNALPATKCIVWPKPYEGSNAVKLFNAQMAAIVAAHSNVHVVDWNATAQQHPEWILPDHIHYTQDGFDHYAEMLRTSALLCGSAST